MTATGSLSFARRSDILRSMTERELDVLVIGGGITGAGIALDAATRGLRVALVEMQDFAAGTSSRSTKLVHGGLRYLKQLEIGVVSEVGKERAIVYENAAHVTAPERMLLPLYAGGTYGKLATSLGLRLYDYLAGVKHAERRTMLSAQETLSKEPLLKTQGLKGGGYYVEYRTDDARLTIEVVKAAHEHGALIVNYARADSLVYGPDGRLTGARIVDLLTEQTYQVTAAKLVNAAGPWVDEVRRMDGSLSGKTLRLTKGVHLVFDQTRFPLRQAVYFDTPDGRMVFAIPRAGKTYFGTTDTNYSGDIDAPKIAQEDRDYLLHAANSMFPSLLLLDADIESSWAGLRPLIHQEGKDPSEISRKDEIFHSPSGLISIAGGKLTGYRKMAETIVDDLVKRLRAEGSPPGSSATACRTKKLPLSGGDFGGSAGYSRFVERVALEGRAQGFSADDAEQLARYYGSNVPKLFKAACSKAFHEWAARHGLPLRLAAELHYAMEEEMAAKPQDFLVRRSGWMFFRISSIKEWGYRVIEAMAEKAGWTDRQKDAYRIEVESLYFAATRAAP